MVLVTIVRRAALLTVARAAVWVLTTIGRELAIFEEGTAALEFVAEGATELHIVGGLNTKLPFEYYTDLFSSLKREFPALHLKALTMVELDFFARFYKMSDEEVIEKLKAAGMDSCPGGGAEIFAEPTRSRICDHKCDGARWL